MLDSTGIITVRMLCMICIKGEGGDGAISVLWRPQQPSRCQTTILPVCTISRLCCIGGGMICCQQCIPVLAYDTAEEAGPMLQQSGALHFINPNRYMSLQVCVSRLCINSDSIVHR